MDRFPMGQSVGRSVSSLPELMNFKLLGKTVLVVDIKTILVVEIKFGHLLGHPLSR